jgi:hypothetical protein
VPIVSVPEPDRVPLSEISAFASAPTVGLLPNGKLQLLEIVLLIEPVCVKVTRLKVTELQLKVAAVEPSNVSVPEL